MICVLGNPFFGLRYGRRAVDVGKANWRIGLEGGYQLLPVGDVGG